MIDEAIVRLHAGARAELAPPAQAAVDEGLVLVAQAGYGRGDLAPFSDVDLVFLHDQRHTPTVLDFTKKLVRAIWDVGLSLGQNVTTARDLLTLARQDALPATSLLEARRLVGSEALWRALEGDWKRALKRGGAARLYQQASAAIAEEQQKFGSSVHLLEPNIKRTAGGLRDIHFIRWLARAFHDTVDFAALEERGVLGAGDARAIEEAHEFLLRLRAELHFHAGNAADTLFRSEQWRIAKARGYEDKPPFLAVERFMRDYYFLTTRVVDVLGRLRAKCRPRSYAGGVRSLLLTRRAGPGIKIGPTELSVADDARPLYVNELERTLELIELAADAGVDLDRTTVEALRRAYGGSERTLTPPNPGSPGHGGELPDPVVRRFLSLLARPGALGKGLRFMHQVGVLERLIPEFEPVRCLLQFNEYHKYTVDEHTFVMLEHAESFRARDDLVGKAYARVARKDLLHLAILLHDLGKAFPEDHSEVGRTIALATAARFRLTDSETETLVFLVHRHLLLSNLAYRRDTTDPAVWVQLARDVGSGENLRMLYVLTVADNLAVGPGTFTQWKSDLLAHLFSRALSTLGEEELPSGLEEQATAIREDLLARHGADEATAAFIRGLPAAYLVETTAEEVDAHLLQWRLLPRGNVATLTRYLPSTNTVVYTILTHESVTTGLFHKICGALAAHHLEILAARIHTMADGTVVDRFEVIDTHHTGPPTPERVKLVGNTIRRVLVGELEVSDVLWSSRPSIFAPKRHVPVPEQNRVEIDNASSAQCTVVDVFTTDRHRLLFQLSGSLYRQGLSIQYAKIATYAHEVVDVFYVQDGDGHKVLDEARLRSLREQLLRDIRQLANDPRAAG